MAVILVLDRSPVVREFMTRAFPSKYCFLTCEDWSEALPKLRNISFDLVLVDLDMIKSYGSDLITSIRARQKCRVLLYSAEPRSILLRWTKQCNADGYLQKIIDPELTIGLLLPFFNEQKEKKRPSRLFRRSEVDQLKVDLGETTKYRVKPSKKDSRRRSTTKTLAKTTRLNVRNLDDSSVIQMR